MKKTYGRSRTGYRIWLSLLMIVFSCKSPSTGNTTGQNQPSAAEKEQQEGGSVYMEIPNHPLQSAEDLDVLLQEIGDARIVLLGEASHGTSEYYTWRTAITKRLLQEKDFDFVAVEEE